MIGIISFTPDELANILEAVLAENGIAVERVSIHRGDQWLDFDRVEVSYEPTEPVRVYKRPREDEEMQRLLYPPLTPEQQGVPALKKNEK